MKWNIFLSRKLPYLGAIVLLLVPISWLSMPPSGQGTQQASPGGQLAQLRAEHGLAQASLGTIDPTSETIRLATLGLRPVAANVLWYKANEFKKREDWYNLKATVDTVTKLQPHFISVWRFQAWNLAYNVSVEWDDYRDRYFWVKSGIEFLEEGTRINRKEASLPWDTGWFISQKMGKADEHKEFRVLFFDDDEFHNDPKRQQVLGASQTRDERDSWLVGKRYYLLAQQMVDSDTTGGKVRVKGLSPNVMHAEVPLNQIHYAEALVKEGTFGEKARQAWAKALREWAGDGPDSYGQRLLATPAGPQRMNDFEKYDTLAQDRLKKLKSLSDGVYEKLYDERFKKLTPDEQKAVTVANGPEADRATEETKLLAAQCKEKLKIDHRELAASMPPALKKQASEIAADAMEAEHNAYWINRYAEVVNFFYWKTRCLSEQTRNTQDSHEQLFKARKAAPQGHFEEAQDAYELAMEQLRVSLDEYKLLLEDGLTGQDIMEIIREYQTVLGHLDEKFPVKGYGLVAPAEVADWVALSTQLSAGAEPGAAPTLASRIAGYWRDKKEFAWAEAATTAAAQVAKRGKMDPALQTDLIYGLNQAIQWPALVREEDLTGVTLRPAVAALAKSGRENLAPRLIRQFNRQVLEDAWGKTVLVQLADPPGFVLDNVLRQHEALIKEKLLPFDESKNYVISPDQRIDVKRAEKKTDETKGEEKKEPEKKELEDKKPEELKKVEEKKPEEKQPDKKPEEPAKKVEAPPTKAVTPATPVPPTKAVTPPPPAKTAPVPAKPAPTKPVPAPAKPAPKKTTK